MIIVVKNAEVYSPKYLGKKDVVIAGDKIEGVYDKVNIPKDFIDIVEIDGSNKLLFPGFIDSHVHIIGGGGEGGFETRTPEIMLSSLTEAGITSVVGCIGTDSICRNMSSLIAKAKGLEIEGITTYCYTGSYEIPVKTMTKNIKEDLMIIDKVIGVGEVALSDNRSMQPTYEEFVSTVAQARVGGLLSGKAGIVNVHMGAGRRGMEYLFKIIEGTEIPPSQLLPTHINRCINLFNEGVEYVKKGGYVDFTTSSDPDFLEEGELTASEALKRIYELGLPIENVTFSSDGNGSMPKFNKERELIGLGICSVKSLYTEVKKAILNENIPIEIALQVITSNVARILKLGNKGHIAKNMCADLVLVNKDDLSISKVIAKGNVIVEEGRAIVKGVFEE